MIVGSKPGLGSGIGSIGGPDRFGFLYITGYRIRDLDAFHSESEARD